MRKKIFITYGDAIYYESLQRIREQATSAGCFDEIITYTDADLPEQIRNHPLHHYKRGGGYWLWKPYFILKTLLEVAQEDDIIVYSDAGSEVFKHSSWDSFFKMMETHGLICFKITALMKYWTRKNLLEAYSSSCHNIDQMWQIMSGISFWTRKALPVAQEWYNVMLSHPEYVLDVTPEEREKEIAGFIENRHDQSVLTCVAHKYQCTCNVKIMWNSFYYLYPDGNAVFTARIASTEARKNGTPHVVFPLWRRAIIRIRHIFRDIREVVYKHVL